MEKWCIPMDYKIISHYKLNKHIYLMKLLGDTKKIKRAGQFVNIKIPGKYLRRPISISDYDDHSITIIYKVLGMGTKILSQMKEDEKIDVLVGLGNGFNTKNTYKRNLLVGGGIGIPPLMKLAKDLKNEKKDVSIVAGFNTKDDVYGLSILEEMGIDVRVTTMDGSYGEKGVVTDIIDENKYDYMYACGPIPMLKSLSKLNIDGQFSMEERMGCGFGGCMGCTNKTKNGFKRICTEGPVLEKNEIIFE